MIKQQLYDVIIVGAGPVGLSLGIFLAGKGLNIMVLEKESATSEHSRAPSLWPRTLETLAHLEVIEIFLQKALKIAVMKIWDADNSRIIFEAPFIDLQSITPYPWLLIVPQSETEKILLAHLKAQSSAHIRFNCEVDSLVQSKSEVTVSCKSETGKMNFAAKLVAGVDGAHSTVREHLKASFDGRTFPVKAALADIHLKNKDFQSPFRISTAGGPAIGIQMKENVWRVILPFTSKKKQSLNSQIEDAVLKLFGKGNWKLIWKSEFSIHDKISSVFAEGRVVLAGDAAHLNSPVGGQGMNAGIQDVERLGKAIVDSLDQNCTMPLDSYSKKRKKEIEHGVNRFTRRLTKWMLVYGRGKFIRPVFYFFNLLIKIKPIKFKLLKRMTMLS